MNEPRPLLCVDDEPLILEGLERTLGQSFQVITRTKPLEALALLEKREHDFVAIISDMRMPLMDGARFLAKAAEIAPDATRVLLTGHAELSAAVAAVNTGRIFRFLCKPCAPSELLGAIEAAADQHRLRHLEKEFFEQTLTGSVRLLAEVLMLVSPRMFTRTQRIRAYVVFMAQRLARPDVWRFELAACMSMIGCVSLPEDTVVRALNGGSLEEHELRAFAEHPLTAHRLLAKIPRFEDIAEMIRLQAELPLAPSLTPPSPEVALGARLLRVARRVERLVSEGATEANACARLLSNDDLASDADLLEILAAFELHARSGELKELRASELTSQMCAERDIKTRSGAIVAPAGKQLTQLLLERIQRFSRAGLLSEPIWVRVP
jgi:DNA-binding NarL/FixJ family response regulator